MYIHICVSLSLSVYTSKYIYIYIYIYISPPWHRTSPGRLESTRPGRDLVTSRLLGQHTTWARACDRAFSWGGAPTGGGCPVFSTTALQDLGLQPQSHPSNNTSAAPHHVGASL